MLSLKYTIRFVTAVLISIVGIANSKAADQTPPNIIFILCDDMGYGDLGCYGSKNINTPNIDRMAKEGVKLTSFYASAPICTPTRASFMTGCYAERVGLSTPLHVYDEVGINSKEITVAEVLQNAGYKTACIGKWHLGHRHQDHPSQHGFDFYWGTPMGHMFNRLEVGKAIDDTSDSFLDQHKEIPFPEFGDLTEKLTQQSVSFINQNKKKPFFLFLSHPMPHEPLAVSKKFEGKSKAGLYGDVIECIDWSTGQILDSIKNNGIEKNTIVVFTSDNGPKKGDGSAGPFRGFKHDPYEGGVRMPCVFWGPGRIAENNTYKGIATMMDLFPTFASFANTEVPMQQKIDGFNIKNNLTHSGTKVQQSEFFYFIRHGILAGVRVDNWKLLIRDRRKRVLELFDLKNDPTESQNLSVQKPMIVKRLKKRMKVFESELKATQRKPSGNYAAEPPWKKLKGKK